MDDSMKESDYWKLVEYYLLEMDKELGECTKQLEEAERLVTQARLQLENKQN